jgi:CubicO group peptidase (beta-lactamase class C family)
MQLRPCLLALALAACGSPPRSPATLAANDNAAIARVENGLIPEVRVAGEPVGWSIAARLERYHVPAVSIAVIHDHRVAWARAYGVKDRAPGARADADTRFQAASISKMVTALAALREADAGKVALDADVNRALSSWKLPDNDLTRDHPVTLAQLLAHTAGTNVHSVSGYAPGDTLPTLPQVLDGRPPAKTAPVRVEETPGKAFRYSGGGSLIVQQLIVDLTQRPFADAVEALVFSPLQMRHSTFAILPPARELPLRAQPYDWDESLLPWLVYPESAAAGLWSTPSDLARLLVAVQQGLKGRSPIVSPAIARAMTTAVAPLGVPGASTGLGTFVERHGDAVYFGHDGLNDGYLSTARATVEGGEGAVVMCNSAGGAQLMFEIMRSIAAEYHWPGWLDAPVVRVAVPRAHLAELAGDYTAGVDDPLTLGVDGNRLLARQPFAAPRELIPLGGDRFITRDKTRFELRGDTLVETPADDDPITRRRSRAADEPLRLLAAGRDEAALARYRALLQARPDDPALSVARFDEIASGLLDRDWAPADAARVFAVAAALHPDSAYANAGLALAYLRANRKAEAAPLYARARQLAAAHKLPEMQAVYLGIRLDRLKRGLEAPGQ